jgi:hypothetical protein
MKVMISGSRTLTNDKVVEAVRQVLDDLLKQHQDLVLLSGGAKGVDFIAETWAKTHNVPCTKYLPDYARYKRGAPLKRNIEMIGECDRVIAFWDGKSPGTKHVIKHGKDKLLSLHDYKD